MRPLILPDSGRPFDFNSVPIASISGYDGLIAIGANFLPETLLSAYRCGLFPWYRYKGLPYWYCPDPRMVLHQGQLHITKSMKSLIKQHPFKITCDLGFESTIRACAGIKRKNEDATWIDADFIKAYTRLHHAGYAHSFEAWQNDQLVGGLYGIGIGKVFFGESMFSNKSNASKLAFIEAVRFLEYHGFRMVDCQVSTEHLKSLGAKAISKEEYLRLISDWALPGSMDGIRWNERFIQHSPL
ncbi:MAG: leucyl/phenylalanyl-tRNA--protein transferase [Saprospiraceae bacterium]|nr:leucyl/phenylalanyl-tRNA--protein transferase [Saprospiraceae bacterium]